MLNQLKPAEKPAPKTSEDDSEARSIGIGIACTVLFHVLVLWLSPNFAFEKFNGVHTGINVGRPDNSTSFDFNLEPGPIKPPEPDPSQFVETNPEAPENTPDKTANFSNRNQQSAQPDPAKEIDPENRPSVKGQDEIKNESAIVSGDMAPPQLASTPPSREESKEEAEERTEQTARAEQVPLSGFDKTEGTSEDGIATNVASSKSPTNHTNEALEGAPDANDPTGGIVAISPSHRVAPKERPRLSSASMSRSTILTNRVTGVTNIGILGIDARWSEYGEYLNELLEIIQLKWYSILSESRVSAPRGSSVVITFKINSQGETEIVKVEDSDAGRQAVFSCQNAITYPQPYRKWTQQMIALMGDSQQITLSFHHQ